MSPRQTRSQTKAANPGDPAVSGKGLEITAPGTARVESQASSSIARLPKTLTRASTGLSAKDHKTLLRKQTWLERYSMDIPTIFSRHAAVVDATLVFAQEEAGTAVCIAPGGLLLTCSHCVAESVEEWQESKYHWLLFKSGIAVKAICLAWDDRRDLALLKISAAQSESGEDNAGLNFPHVLIGFTVPAPDSRLVCIGHPGSEDLEASQPGIKTNYDVLHASTGRFRGYAKNQDPQNNLEIGALMHDCWTYWGHSGAPLLDVKTGRLVGLHSSWDDQTGMRRGVPLEAIREFVEMNNKHITFTTEQSMHEMNVHAVNKSL